MHDGERVDPVDRELKRRKWRRRAIYLLTLLTVAIAVYWLFLAAIPVDYESDVDHFKYGSIGSDYDGIPLRIWKVLPELFPDYLPHGGEGFRRIPDSSRDYLDGYAQFGFLVEENRPLPVGFSQRRVYVDRVGLNCAVCHTSTVAVTSGSHSEQIYGERIGDATKLRQRTDGPERFVVLGMPANTMDLEAYFVFLFRCAEDSRFTTDAIMAAIDAQAKRNDDAVGPIERIILKRAIPQLRETLQRRRDQLSYLALLPHATGDDVMPRFGPGRVDTFSPYKSLQFGFPFDGTYGIADYPSIWNQRPRDGMQLHWDGNNTSVFERNISASLGAGVTPVTIDMDRMLRVADWIGSPRPPFFPDENHRETTSEEVRRNPFPHDNELPIPEYPFAVDESLLDEGGRIYAESCAACHDWTKPDGYSGPGVGEVIPIEKIGTDRARLDSYTEALEANQNLLGAGQVWRFNHFRKTHGYSNMPLDGLWARAPYLHNGSIPTLADLLNEPCLSLADLARVGLPDAKTLSTLEQHPERVAEIIRKARSEKLRPPVFYRGDDEYDPVNVGFRCDRPVSGDGRPLFLYSTVTVRDGRIVFLVGNGHQGHTGEPYGTTLSDDEKRALVEYQKRLGQRLTEPAKEP